jgi:hypothetical protein
MVYYLLFFCLINYVYSFEPACTTCRFFIPNTLNTNFGLCKLFQENIYDNNNKEYIVNNVALQCRTNQNLCGKEGKLYQSINKKFQNYEYIRRVSNNRCEYETNLEKLEKLERELVDIFQKMRKHNTKKIYKKTKNFIDKL